MSEKNKHGKSETADPVNGKLSTKEYERQLARLQVELAQLQAWVRENRRADRHHLRRS